MTDSIHAGATQALDTYLAAKRPRLFRASAELDARLDYLNEIRALVQAQAEAVNAASFAAAKADHAIITGLRAQAAKRARDLASASKIADALRDEATELRAALADANENLAAAQSTILRRDDVIAGLRERAAELEGDLGELREKLAGHVCQPPSIAGHALTPGELEQSARLERERTTRSGTDGGQRAVTAAPLPSRATAPPLPRSGTGAAEPAAKRPRTARTAPDGTGTGQGKAGSARRGTGRSGGAK